MPALVANLDPIRLLDEVTTRLGNLLLDFIPRTIAFLQSLTRLPAGLQVLIVIGGLLCLGLSLRLMRKAFGEAAEIRKGVRDARHRTREARADLAISDRRKAWGYVFLVGVALGGAILLIFVYQSIIHAPPLSE